MEPQASPQSPNREAAHPGGEYLRLLVEAVVDYAIFALDPQGRVVT
jgi:hypothetical protein